ncbi:PASTA domain-containing protein [Solwaraspora sp. WMMD1047]|uniref:PASTA domain-containing protein n=1 Tax=Solwaraspora sp. WMMD1047 TaxID=3016102 RepID=UPI002417E1DC|nr:PASTA domain-containing protein [Solwaraspora sp. WMMD1047]MDG4834661.1 PASTA domain-containing protein [Solwaraspora sp. WMMD1047]
MADGFPGGAEPQRPAGRGRLPLVAGVIAGFVLLAAIGTLSGWLLAGGVGGDADPEDRLAGASPTATTPAPVPTTPEPEPPAVTPDRPTALPEVPDNRLRLPDLVGTDFKEARTELRKRGLGWQVIFGAAGDDPAVSRTEPRAGTTVGRGTTVKLYVVGAAPAVAVPEATGLPCARAAAKLIDNGLYPRYPTGKVGPVVRQDPAAGTEVRWNDQVNLYCGGDPDRPSASPEG